MLLQKCEILCKNLDFILPFGNHHVGNFFFCSFIQQWEGFLQILLYTINESVQTSTVVFFNS